MNKIEHVLNIGNELGESPIWMPDEQALYWIDIEGCKVFKYTPSTKDLKTFEVDFPITSLWPCADGRWITAAKTGLFYWDSKTGQSEFILDPEADAEDLRCNDAVVDRQGRLLVGTINGVVYDSPDGSIYRYDGGESIVKLDSGFACSNGIGFSPNGKTIYAADSFNNRIRAYDYDTDAGTVSGCRDFATIAAEDGFPDGLIVDSEGFVWNAHWAGGRIRRYDPSGKMEREIKLPVANTTCLAFGGEQLDELYITTAWFTMSDEDRKANPTAGDLFRIKTDVKGLVEPKFKGL
jgi:sugar lactone lactonase YvrE